MEHSKHNNNDLKHIMEQLENGVRDMMTSEKYIEFLRVMSRFHEYSLNNTILIMLQRPTATLVAGYRAWQTKFDRQVTDGQKAIKILAPVPIKTKIVRETLDQEGKFIRDLSGKPVMEEVEVLLPRFKVVSVFDVAQTSGKELPTLTEELKGQVKRYDKIMKALREISPVPIDFEDIKSGAKGYFSSKEQRIVIQNGMEELQTIKTLLHEIAHAKLHDPQNMKDKRDDDIPDRSTKEVEAESVAFVVCNYYGLDTSQYSFAYVGGWSKDQELTQLKGSLETIRNAAGELIKSIDAAMNRGREKASIRERMNQIKTTNKCSNKKTRKKQEVAR